jgi:hypothetical protein
LKIFTQAKKLSKSNFKEHPDAIIIKRIDMEKNDDDVDDIHCIICVNSYVIKYKDGSLRCYGKDFFEKLFFKSESIFGRNALNNKMYVVIRCGIYIRGIFGICDNVLNAKKIIENAKSKEDDDYHDFYIIEIDTNKEIYIDSNNLDEYNIIYSIERKKETK